MFAQQAAINRPLLFAGAGVSADLGYPTWGNLIAQLAKEFAPGQPLTTDPRANFDLIEEAARTGGQLESLYDELDRIFDPRSRTSPDVGYIRRLLAIRFCGVATTNFDTAIEEAVTQELFMAGKGYSCSPLDLCDDRPNAVFHYVRGLASDKCDSVLHVHGVHSAPRRLILGERAFCRAYGFRVGERVRHFETRHSKTLEQLFTARSVLFVGFGLSDPFFQEILDFIKREFRLRKDNAFFVLSPIFLSNLETANPKDHDEARTIAQAAAMAKLPTMITPIFYDAFGKDHSRLWTLVDELVARVGGQSTTDFERLVAKSREERAS